MCTLKPGSGTCKTEIEKASNPNKASGCVAVTSKTTCGCQSFISAPESKKNASAALILEARKKIKNLS